MIKQKNKFLTSILSIIGIFWMLFMSIWTSVHAEDYGKIEFDPTTKEFNFGIFNQTDNSEKSSFYIGSGENGDPVFKLRNPDGSDSLSLTTDGNLGVKTGWQTPTIDLSIGDSDTGFSKLWENGIGVVTGGLPSLSVDGSGNVSVRGGISVSNGCIQGLCNVTNLDANGDGKIDETILPYAQGDIVCGAETNPKIDAGDDVCAGDRYSVTNLTPENIMKGVTFWPANELIGEAVGDVTEIFQETSLCNQTVTNENTDWLASGSDGSYTYTTNILNQWRCPDETVLNQSYSYIKDIGTVTKSGSSFDSSVDIFEFDADTVWTLNDNVRFKIDVDGSCYSNCRTHSYNIATVYIYYLDSQDNVLGSSIANWYVNYDNNWSSDTETPDWATVYNYPVNIVGGTMPENATKIRVTVNSSRAYAQSVHIQKYGYFAEYPKTICGLFNEYQQSNSSNYRYNRLFIEKEKVGTGFDITSDRESMLAEVNQDLDYNNVRWFNTYYYTGDNSARGYRLTNYFNLYSDKENSQHMLAIAFTHRRYDRYSGENGSFPGNWYVHYYESNNGGTTFSSIGSINLYYEAMDYYMSGNNYAYYLNQDNFSITGGKPSSIDQYFWQKITTDSSVGWLFSNYEIGIKAIKMWPSGWDADDHDNFYTWAANNNQIYPEYLMEANEILPNTLPGTGISSTDYKLIGNSSDSDHQYGVYKQEITEELEGLTLEVDQLNYIETADGWSTSNKLTTHGELKDITWEDEGRVFEIQARDNVDFSHMFRKSEFPAATVVTLNQRYYYDNDLNSITEVSKALTDDNTVQYNYSTNYRINYDLENITLHQDADIGTVYAVNKKVYPNINISGGANIIGWALTITKADLGLQPDDYLSGGRIRFSSCSGDCGRYVDYSYTLADNSTLTGGIGDSGSTYVRTGQYIELPPGMETFTFTGLFTTTNTIVFENMFEYERGAKIPVYKTGDSDMNYSGFYVQLKQPFDITEFPAAATLEYDKDDVLYTHTMVEDWANAPSLLTTANTNMRIDNIKLVQDPDLGNVYAINRTDYPTDYSFENVYLESYTTSYEFTIEDIGMQATDKITGGTLGVTCYSSNYCGSGVIIRYYDINDQQVASYRPVSTSSRFYSNQNLPIFPRTYKIRLEGLFGTSGNTYKMRTIRVYDLFKLERGELLTEQGAGLTDYIKYEEREGLINHATDHVPKYYSWDTYYTGTYNDVGEAPLVRSYDRNDFGVPSDKDLSIERPWILRFMCLDQSNSEVKAILADNSEQILTGVLGSSSNLDYSFQTPANTVRIDVSLKAAFYNNCDDATSMNKFGLASDSYIWYINEVAYSGNFITQFDVPAPTGEDTNSTLSSWEKLAGSFTHPSGVNVSTLADSLNWIEENLIKFGGVVTLDNLTWEFKKTATATSFVTIGMTLACWA